MSPGSYGWKGKYDTECVNRDRFFFVEGEQLYLLRIPRKSEIVIVEEVLQTTLVL